MKAHNKDFSGSPRILELNPSHELITGLKDKIKADKDPDLVHDAATMLFDQALILEGSTPVNLNEFANRMTRLMQRGISA